MRKSIPCVHPLDSFFTIIFWPLMASINTAKFCRFSDESDEKDVLPQCVNTFADRDFLSLQPSIKNPIEFNYLFKEKPNTSRDDEITAEDVYEENGGTVIVACIDNKLVIAADTRHSSDFTINSRNMSKIFRIGDFFLCSSGFYADAFELYNSLNYAHMKYEYNKKMSLSAAAHRLFNILYANRSFPYRLSPCLAGFENDEASIYSFDCIGSYQKLKYVCTGSAEAMMQPLLDSWFGGNNFQDFKPLSFDESLDLIKKAFDAAAERDVKTKDSLEILIFDGTEETYMREELRKD